MKRIAMIVWALLLVGCTEDYTTEPTGALRADVVTDFTPPSLTAFSFSPTSINTSDGGVNVTVSFTVTDDISGATSIFVYFANPSGTPFLSGFLPFTAATTFSGSVQVGFPQYSQSGTWTVSDVVLQDAAGNRRDVFTADLSAIDFPTTVSVFSLLEDVTPPTLIALNLAPSTISTTNGPATVTVSFTVTDDVSGANGVFTVLCGPSGSTRSGFSAFTPATSRTGSFPVTFPQLSEVGTWTLCAVIVRDGASNSRGFNTQELVALGFPTVLVVASVITVSIDIQPGSSVNSIKPSRLGKVPAAILSGVGFDAPSKVDRTSLTFGRSGDEASLASCANTGEDVNGDGFKDLVCHFYLQRTGFQTGDVEGILRGRTTDQIPIEGRDAVRVMK